VDGFSKRIIRLLGNAQLASLNPDLVIAPAGYGAYQRKFARIEMYSQSWGHRFTQMRSERDLTEMSSWSIEISSLLLLQTSVDNKVKQQKPIGM
jgi:hypothetical protein